jgi:carbamate kinase
MARIMIAIGGNAILNPENGNPLLQKRQIDETCREIMEIIQEGYDVVLTHGNGPQIGNILAMQDECGLVQAQTLDVCGAQTQGMLGYLLQQSLGNRLREKGIEKPVVTVLTQVVVDESCDSFEKPTKPIGLYYPASRAREMMAQGMKMMKDKNGYRRIVPSPMPVKIIEENIIREIIQNAAVVIAAGGGGIPVINRNGMIEGIEAVIDKDLTGSLLASVIGAEILLILTDVEKAALNYGKDDETGLDEITVSEAERYVKEGHFGKGSMEPKVLAAVKFVRSGGKAAIISSLEKALPALHGETGTRIIA